MATDRSRGAWVGARRVEGFTLIELMIVVAVIAILGTIANASYKGYVIKSRRAAATTCLEERAQFLERYYTTNLTYTGAPNPAQCGPELESFYEVTLNVTDSKSYTLTATPTDRQDDDKCGTLTLNARGQRTASGPSGVADCW
ncbi:putative type IV pilin pile protein [Pseudoxanthomonas suwonensis 11-1]|uniref:Putative type IV pilin pile protein n=1 Tax=Pseudoxanthomonas suwonensis (strain 11-1) TaxID=743721 RepID=E6WRH4_PSEUU|nr:type IV pilin protein [Pseudoxanthomonas suwonensis]ADV26705.1 putative type IV pilin pile protein [Pseudoxanthomonas suwonensis 11-1]